MTLERQRKFSLLGELPDNTLSSMGIGKQLVEFARALQQNFSDIESIELSQNKPQGKISLNDTNAANQLGELIFIKNRYELQKKVKDRRVDPDFVPKDSLIQANINFYRSEEDLGSFRVTASNPSKYSAMNTLSPSKIFFTDFASTSFFFQTVVKYFNPLQAYIQYIDNDFASRVSCKHYFRYGWMSYVADTCSLKVPTDLPYLEYQPFANGTLHILTRENFYDDCEKYEAQLTEIYEQSALKNPELIRKL